MSKIVSPMLCEDLEVNGIKSLDGDKATAAYRKAIAEALSKLVVQGFVAERKGGIAAVPRQHWLFNHREGLTA